MKTDSFSPSDADLVRLQGILVSEYGKKLSLNEIREVANKLISNFEVVLINKHKYENEKKLHPNS